MNPIKFHALTIDKCDKITKHLLDLESKGLYEIWRVPNSPAFYNPPLGLQVLKDLKEKVSTIIGLDLRPAYSYGRIYRYGNYLPKHIDRKASEFGISITTYTDTDWKLNFDIDGRNIKKSCNVGEGIIYKGSVTPHWRNNFKGKLQIQLLLFYVDSNGDYSNLENDNLLGTSSNIQIPNLETRKRNENIS
jgi:hypothetical protein|tara:strand:+ start:2556 stop:3125 length:570 start_codon:yes stop_codon:yes gene_type:complete